jgi:hypothetical protein
MPDKDQRCEQNTRIVLQLQTQLIQSNTQKIKPSKGMNATSSNISKEKKKDQNTYTGTYAKKGVAVNLTKEIHGRTGEGS